MTFDRVAVNEVRASPFVPAAFGFNVALKMEPTLEVFVERFRSAPKSGIRAG